MERVVKLDRSKIEESLEFKDAIFYLYKSGRCYMVDLTNNNKFVRITKHEYEDFKAILNYSR